MDAGDRFGAVVVVACDIICGHGGGDDVLDLDASIGSLIELVGARGMSNPAPLMVVECKAMGLFPVLLSVRLCQRILR